MREGEKKKRGYKELMDGWFLMRYKKIPSGEQTCEPAGATLLSFALTSSASPQLT